MWPNILLEMICSDTGSSIYFLIIVEDTGVGFDPNHKKDDGRSHLGLENVKRRISMMSHGDIEIDSVIGEGTIIKIELPKEL